LVGLFCIDTSIGNTKLHGMRAKKWRINSGLGWNAFHRSSRIYKILAGTLFWMQCSAGLADHTISVSNLRRLVWQILQADMAPSSV
jgi:hypothetical protein